ncbi:hypothetical protein BJV77DRAFT_1057877 [Russula vinacea]|nr:hypothetical protein BJV77DRAFT_1057877 [Russula vinacea]
MVSDEAHALCPNSNQLTNIADGRSILTLVVFFLSNIIVIFPFRIPLPRTVASASHDLLVKFRTLPRTSEPLRKLYLSVNFLSGPMISVLLLLAVKAINGAALKHGIMGTDGVLPISIMALFISLAYISISLDATGLLRFLAFWAPGELYFYLYLFFLVCAAVVGNDPVVLSGTTFLAYLTRVLGITPPTAWIFSQFAAVNMASAVLISSNPTNLVLSGAFSLSFVTYTSSVALPFLAAALIVYLYLSLVLFRSVEYIPASIELPSGGVGGDGVGIDRPSAALIDKAGAIFGSILLIATLGALTGTSTVGIPVWQVAVPAAAMMLSHDLWRDWRCHHRASGLPFSSSPPRHGSHTVRHSRRQLALSTVLSMWSHSLVQTFPTVHAVYRQLPLSLVPFAFLMFILVQALTSQGWVGIFACWWGAWVDKTGVLGAAGGMVIGSGLLCNVCHYCICVYGLALGSNYGAFTLAFSASLAGLLWRDMLRQKGIHVRQYHFAKLNMGTFVVASVASGVVLIGQTLVVHA